MRDLLPAVLALAVALAVDLVSARRGLLPPKMAVGPLADGSAAALAAGRRSVAVAVVAMALWVGVFAPLAALGQAQELDLDRIHPAQLFLLHGLFVVALLVWAALGYGFTPGTWMRQLGLRLRRVGRELAVGLASGMAIWAVVMAVMLAIGATLWAMGEVDLLTQEAPPLVPWIAGLPISVRVAVSLSAGVVEEIFFRGFLQPRIGVGVSTACFVLAHASYEQPLMLVGVALLSLAYAGLVRWRQSVWAAIVAHFVFDVVQLLIVVPSVVETIGDGAPLGIAFARCLGLGG